MKMIRSILIDIFAEVSKHQQRNENEVYFYISYNNNIIPAKSIKDLRNKSRTDYYKNFNDSSLKDRSSILVSIGNELNQLYGNKFQTVHETSCNSWHDELYPINERKCSGLCYIYLK